MRLFLSYAEEDQGTAQVIATWLAEQGFEVFYWQDPRQRGERFVQRTEEEITEADAFLALLSPNFVTSPWCRFERELAIQRDLDLRAGDPPRGFIYVLQVVETPYPEAGFLRNFDWLDLTTEPKREEALPVLADKIQASSVAAASRPGMATPGPRPPLFRNRRDELEKLVRGVANSSGPHFWLVIAPPELGKSWFLDRVSTEVAPDSSNSEAGRQGWETRLVDVGELPLDARGDAALVLQRLFGLDPPTTTGVATLRAIARRLVGGRRPFLCLLDSAELLGTDAARHLRFCLSEIYRFVRDAAAHSDIRLAVVVASRREVEWRGVTPIPRISLLSLTEFSVDVARQALYDLAQQMDRTFSAAELQQHAERVHGLSEGLPALLVRCLQWIQAEEWVDMEQLEGQDLFEVLARPYIQDGLLSVDSLVPWGGRQVEVEQERAVLVQAFRVLAPYRLFTQSHLRHHLDSDRELREALKRRGWPIEDLWRAIGETALLSRPLNELWQEIYAAIRRLLFRYYYKTDEERAAAHRRARKFVEAWASNQAGKEQIVGVVECLWHEAVVLRLQQPSEVEAELSKAAQDLSRTLKESAAYTVTELRAYAGERMRNDEELQEVVSGVPGLFDRLVDIVAPGPGESPHD